MKTAGGPDQLYSQFFFVMMYVLYTRAPIDQSFLRELSASLGLNLVSDRAAHPVYSHSHSWLCMPPTHTGMLSGNEPAPGHSLNSDDCNLTLLCRDGGIMCQNSAKYVHSFYRAACNADAV